MRSVATGSPANINIKKFDIQDIGSRVGGLFDVTSSIPLNRDEIEAEHFRVSKRDQLLKDFWK